jgi:hypothetical protein
LVAYYMPVSYRVERERDSIIDSCCLSKRLEPRKCKNEREVLILVLSTVLLPSYSLLLFILCMIARTEGHFLRAHHLGSTYSQELSLLANLNFFN